MTADEIRALVKQARREARHTDTSTMAIVRLLGDALLDLVERVEELEREREGVAA